MWYIIFPRERSNLTWQRVDYIAGTFSFKDLFYLCSFSRKSCSTGNYLWSKPTFYNKKMPDASMKVLMNEGSYTSPFFLHTAKPIFVLFSFLFLRAYYCHFLFVVITGFFLPFSFLFLMKTIHFACRLIQQSARNRHNSKQQATQETKFIQQSWKWSESRGC